jgi:hypothetical protein
MDWPLLEVASIGGQRRRKAMVTVVEVVRLEENVRKTLPILERDVVSLGSAEVGGSGRQRLALAEAGTHRRRLRNPVTGQRNVLGRSIEVVAGLELFVRNEDARLGKVRGSVIPEDRFFPCLRWFERRSIGDGLLGEE